VAYADRVRRTIIPRPGHVFVEADSAAIEAVMTGYFMGSAEYVALAKKGIHDYLNCFEHGVPFTDDNILRSKGEWNDARDRNKIVVHGTSYGMTPFLMHKQWPAIFPRIADAEKAQARFFEACPGLAEWQHSVRTFAHKQSYLENPWHYRHYFYDVFKKDVHGTVILGEDAKRCVSFLPQSSAAAFMKDNLILLSESRFWPMPAIGLIHDSYCLEVLEADVEDAIALLVRTLTRPIQEMQNLTIGCEVKVSLPDQAGTRHWNNMISVRKAA
jgi:DNA polymerase I-like protein with 3'-5' exonuclease and polymerase domains